MAIDLSQGGEGEISSLIQGEASVAHVPLGLRIEDATLARWLALGSMYNQQSHPVPVSVVGPTLNQARMHDDTDYYPRTIQQVARSLGSDVEWNAVRAAVRQEVERWFQASSSPLLTPWGPAYWGVLRTINAGAPPHWDDLKREWSGSTWAMPDLARQFAVNVFLRAGENGHLLLWHASDCSESESPFVSVAGEPSLSAKPAQGSAMIFDPTIVHSVMPCDGERVTLSFFVGVVDDDNIVIWS